MSDPTPQEKARDAIFGAIAEQAEVVNDANDADPINRSVKLADAYSKVAYGPQGGDLTRADTDDYHYTQHGGEDRQRPAAGFGR